MERIFLVEDDQKLADVVCKFLRGKGFEVHLKASGEQVEARGFEWDGLDRTIDIRIARLRRKLGDCGRSPAVIKSVRGEGHLLVARL